MSFSDVATVGFAIRNVDKTTSGDLGRLPVAVGQTVNAIKAGAEYNSFLKRGVNAVKKVVESDSVFKGVI